jgi:hypothetical protein
MILFMMEGEVVDLYSKSDPCGRNTFHVLPVVRADHREEDDPEARNRMLRTEGIPQTPASGVKSPGAQHPVPAVADTGR